MSRAQLAAWLTARRPAPPAILGARLERAVHEAPTELTDLALPQALLSLGRALVGELIRQGQNDREHALDLLAGDAFITYAFEAQAELDQRAINRLADEVREA